MGNQLPGHNASSGFRGLLEKELGQISDEAQAASHAGHAGFPPHLASTPLSGAYPPSHLVAALSCSSRSWDTEVALLWEL